MTRRSMSASPPRPPGLDCSKACVPAFGTVLSSIKGGVVVERTPLTRGVTTIGRSSVQSHIVGEHGSLSRAHAAFVGDANGGGVSIVDLASAHGTFVNNVRLTPHAPRPLSQNDAVRLGESSREYRIAYAVDVAVAPAPAPASQPEMNPAAARAAREIEIRAAIASFSVPLKMQSVLVSVDVGLPHEGTGVGVGGGGGGDGDNGGKDDGGGGGNGWAGGCGGGADNRGVDGGGDEESDEYGIVDYDDSGAGTGVGTGADAGGAGVGAVSPSAGAYADSDAPSSSSDEDSPDIIPPPPPTAATAASLAPVSHELLLAGHHKACTTIAIDPSGARLASGSLDGSVRLFDFGGLGPSRAPFRTIPPSEGGHAITALAWSSGPGARLAVATGDARLRVFTREAAPILTTVLGDAYVLDASHTKGHRAAVTGVAFPPGDDAGSRLFSASADGTVRSWDLDGGRLAFGELTCADVYKFRGAKGARAGIAAFALSPDGGMALVACDDGGAHVSRVRAGGGVQSIAKHSAHGGAPLRAAAWAPDGARFATRADDGTVKVWDARRFGGGAAPVASWVGMPTGEASSLAWSPDGALLAVGTGGAGRGASEAERGAAGWLYLLDAAAATTTTSNNHNFSLPFAALRAVQATPDTSILALAWHERTRQVSVGASDGSVRMLYHPTISTKGALLAAARSGMRELGSDFVGGGGGGGQFQSI